MPDQKPVEIGNGQTFLIIVQGERVGSKTFYGYQLPAPEWVAKVVRAAFK